MLEENTVYIKLNAKLGLTVIWNRDDAVMVISAMMFKIYISLFSKYWLLVKCIGRTTAETHLVQDIRDVCTTHRMVVE